MSILSDVVVPILIIISAVLDDFVDVTTGNTLTPTGESLAGAIASLVYNVTIFLAQLSTLLPNGNYVS